jgi:hypothetical protein
MMMLNKSPLGRPNARRHKVKNVKSRNIKKKDVTGRLTFVKPSMVMHTKELSFHF